MPFAFRPRYLFAALFLLLVEILIAVYVRDSVVRPYGGDFLVVILIYCVGRAFLNLSVAAVAAATLLFSFAVEIGQYFSLVDRLGLSGNRLAAIVIGTGFSWGDLLAYTLGVGTVIGVERWRAGRRSDLD